MSRLNYHHLYYFWRVAISGNLTQAARELHVSQSALSSQIRQLEDSMDTRLFERVSRRLVLTDAGQRVLAYAEDIFAKGEELESLLRRGVEPAYQHLRIGMLATMSRNFIEGFIEPLRDNPRVRFSLHAQGMASLLDGLATHQLDLVLTNTQVPVEDRSGPWQVQLLDRQPLALIGPPSLAFHSDFPHGFDSVRWVLPGPGAEIRAAFDSFCALHHYEPQVQAEADDMAMLRLLARDSHALTVLPAVVVQDEIRQGLLVEHMTLPNVFENFYAMTVQRKYAPSILYQLLKQSPDQT